MNIKHCGTNIQISIFNKSFIQLNFNSFYNFRIYYNIVKSFRNVCVIIFCYYTFNRVKQLNFCNLNIVVLYFFFFLGHKINS